MKKRQGDAMITIVVIVAVLLVALVTYFMFFNKPADDNMTNMNNTGANTDTNNQVGIYRDNNEANNTNGASAAGNSTDNNMINDDNTDTDTNTNGRSITNNSRSDMNVDMNIADKNANNFYQRVKRGITLNGKLVEVPAEYMTRLTEKIGAVGYKMTDEASRTINGKYDEIERTLADNNVSDINDLDAGTKDRIDSLIGDIRNAL